MRWLFVCTANVDRSPTAEGVMRAIGPHHETRSAGTAPDAVHPIDDGDVAWAEVIAVMEARHRDDIARRWPGSAGKVRVLDIPDRFRRDEPELRAWLERGLRGLAGEGGGMIGP